jgi:hypothetical protein
MDRARDDPSRFRLLARWPPTESADQLIGFASQPTLLAGGTADVMDSVRLVAGPDPFRSPSSRTPDIGRSFMQGLGGI